MRFSNATMLLYLVAASIAAAQQPWEQMFPRLATRHDIGSIVHWNGDTVFAAGTQFTLLRSIDAGQTWVNMFTHNPGFDFVRMGTDGRYIYLLPYYATKNFFNDFLRDSLQHFLLRYDVRTGDTTRITFPNPNGSPRYLHLFDLSVTRDCITILTCGNGGSLIQSTDLGKSWDIQILPDSIYRNSGVPDWMPTMLFQSKDMGILLAFHSKYGGNILYTTYDGGRSWTMNNTIIYPISPYLYTFPKRPGEWVNDSTVVLVTESNIPIVSTDRGRTWNRKTPLSSVIHSIHTTADGNGYAIGGTYEVFKTTDWWASNVQVHQRMNVNTNRFTGCLVGQDNFIVGGYWGTLHATNDGGTTWNEQIPRYQFTYSFEFFSETEGAATYTDLYSGESFYARTSDQGRTWIEVFNLTKSELSRRVQHLTKEIAFSYPDGVFVKGKLVYRTTDAGTNWSESYAIDPSDTMKIVGRSDGIWNRRFDQVAFVPTNEGLLVSKDHGKSWVLKGSIKQITNHDIWDMDMSHGTSWIMTRECSIYKSTDNGDSWTRMYTVPDSFSIKYPLGIQAISDEEVIATIQLYINGTKSYLLRSTDGGMNWSIRLVHSSLGTIKSFPPGISYGHGGRGAVGYRTQYYFAKTYDLWNSYSEIIDFRDSPGAGSYFFLSENIGWFVGGYYLLHTTNGGISWTELPFPGAKSVSLQPSYPNPVAGSGSTTIPFTVTGNREVHVRIEVHDLLGRKVATVHDKFVQPGSHSALWVTRGVSPGMYFVRIVGAESEVRKLVVR